MSGCTKTAPGFKAQSDLVHASTWTESFNLRESRLLYKRLRGEWSSGPARAKPNGRVGDYLSKWQLPDGENRTSPTAEIVFFQAKSILMRIGALFCTLRMLHVVYSEPRGYSSLSRASAGGQLSPFRFFVLRKRSDRYRSIRALKSKHPGAFEGFPEPLQFADRLA